MAFKRSRQISQMRDRRRVLHGPEFFVSRRQFTLQAAIATRVLRETVEILQSALNDQRTSRCRTGQIHNRVVNFKNEWKSAPAGA